MGYHLAVDAGGSKLMAVLYDDDFRPLRLCRTGSIRTTSTPSALILQNIQTIIRKLGLQGLTLDTLCGVWDRHLYDELRRVCTIKKPFPYDEGRIGLSAAGVFADGFLAVSGTGSTIYCHHQDQNYVSGGYGALLDDEGSGYWIAREAFGAAIRCEEKRGKATVLRDLILRHFSRTGQDFRSAVFTLYHDPVVALVTDIAACTPLVCQAARQRDEAALDILARAGRSLGIQVAALSHSKGLPDDLPVAVSGGVWQGHNLVFTEFCRALRENGLTGPVSLPVFEPIVGAVLQHCQTAVGSVTDERFNSFKEMYKQFLYKSN